MTSYRVDLFNRNLRKDCPIAEKYIEAKFLRVILGCVMGHHRSLDGILTQRQVITIISIGAVFRGYVKGFFYKITDVGIIKTVIKKTDAYTDVCEVRTLRQAF